MPFLYNILGPIAFGVIGFYTVLQLIINVVDSGLSPTLCRVVASDKKNTDKIVRTLKSFETISISLAIIIFSISYFLSEQIIGSWFDGNPILTPSIIVLMFLACSIRLITSIYRSTLQGYEDLIWSNSTSIIINTLRFPICTFVMFYNANIELYFLIQASVSTIEMLAFRLRVGFFMGTYFWLFGRVYLEELTEHRKYILAVAFTALVSALSTHMDKLLFSNILSLEHYGFYTVCITFSAAILSLGFPVGTVLIPRLTSLYSEGDIAALKKLYFKSTSLVCLLIFPIGITISFYSEHFLFAFTNDANASVWGKEILTWYSIANSFVIISAFQYYLQVAVGNLTLHVVFNKIVLLIIAPVVIYLAYFKNVTVVIQFILFVRLFSFLIWMYVVHNKIAIFNHFEWLLKTTLPAVLTLLILMFFHSPVSAPEDLLSSIIEVSLFYIVNITMVISISRILSFVRLENAVK